MSGPRTRRAALRAGAAAVGMLCAPALAMATMPVISLDAELFAALDHCEVIRAQRDASDAEFNAAFDRLNATRPPRPAALVFGHDDMLSRVGHAASQRETLPSGKVGLVFGTGDVERVRAMTCKPGSAAAARRLEILEAHDAWQGACKAVEDAVGYTAAIEASAIEARALDAAEEAVKSCPPRTLAGLARKAEWVARLLACDAADDELAETFARQVAAFAKGTHA